MPGGSARPNGFELGSPVYCPETRLGCILRCLHRHDFIAATRCSKSQPGEFSLQGGMYPVQDWSTDQPARARVGDSHQHHCEALPIPELHFHVTPRTFALLGYGPLLPGRFCVDPADQPLSNARLPTPTPHSRQRPGMCRETQSATAGETTFP